MKTWNSALDGRDDLARYGHNRVLLFALALHEDIDDLQLTANDALTDGANDKKCDLVYIDRDTGTVIVGQGYWSDSPKGKGPPANKASDLNTAAAWLLGGNFETMPDNLRTAAEQLDDAIRSNEVISITFWYVHNLEESANVDHELDKVRETASALLRTRYPDHSVDSVRVVQVGASTLEEWYLGTKAPILVTEELEVPLPPERGFPNTGSNWTAFSTSVPAHWLRDLYVKHGRKLFSANVRDYLGSRHSDRNINHNIKETARTRPDMFWVFNNGVTALVNDFELLPDEPLVLRISGMAIVNGAQTTGAIGSLAGVPLEHVFVPARFVKCSDSATVQDIIRFNNSQNKIEAADFRSNDAVQTRLREEFEAVPDVVYLGGRRGGAQDKMRRLRNQIPSYAAGQALIAFHGDPETAYNQRSQIWSNDRLYSKVFNAGTTARHVLCAYALLKAVDRAKANLISSDSSSLTDNHRRQQAVMRKRGATFLLASAIASALEIFVNAPIPDRFEVRFVENLTPQKAIDAWEPVVQVAMPAVIHLDGALSSVNLKNQAVVSDHVGRFTSFLESLRNLQPGPFTVFARKIAFR